jgi:calcineurin-like phosphoesterase family protein
MDELFKKQEKGLIEFTKSLIPGIKEEVIGCRTPDIKDLARQMIKKDQHMSFLKNLPHKYHEENLLHGYILARIKTTQEELIDLYSDEEADIYLFGHTHSKDKFSYPHCYNVALDAHDNKPVEITEILEDIKNFNDNITKEGELKNEMEDDI